MAQKIACALLLVAAILAGCMPNNAVEESTTDAEETLMTEESENTEVTVQPEDQRMVLGTMNSLDDGWVSVPSLALSKRGNLLDETRYYEFFSNNDIVLMKQGIQLDLTPYSRDGMVHIDVYVDNPAQIIGGQIEFCSSGMSDIDEFSFGDFGIAIPLEAGWNSIDLPFNSAHKVGGTPDLANITYIRIYFNVVGTVTVGVDNLYIWHGEEQEFSEETDPFESMSDAFVQAVENARKASVLNAGGQNNRAAIAAVLAKAASGQDITIATLGDSITAGAVSYGDKCWAGLLRKWFAQKYPDITVKLVNAGIGSTEGVYGVCRAEKDVLSAEPDLVIVDFGTNDFYHIYPQEAYEGIVRKLLGQGIPMINLNACPRNGNNTQDQLQQVNERYGVPQISLRSSYFAALSGNANIDGLRAEEIWATDMVHPSDIGHRLIADLITNYLQSYILDENIAPVAQNRDLPAPVTANGYEDAVLVESSDSISDSIRITNEGWSGYSANMFELHDIGWQTFTEGAALTFEIQGGYFEIFYAMSVTAGNLEIRVDGQLVGTITNASSGGGYMQPYHAIHLDQPGTHVVELKMVRNTTTDTAWFGICSVGVANGVQ